MKTYSTELRQKIIDAYNNEEGSQRQLAKRFSVSLSFVQSVLRRFRFCDTVEAKLHSGGHGDSRGSMEAPKPSVKKFNELTDRRHLYRGGNATRQF
ncbi:MAG: hypothetical protein KME46_08140 [Brasilonema angustatum HA4187-MV1]|nr:hypothetical protein [Brasilonema angustatum HA4187-MV1]